MKLAYEIRKETAKIWRCYTYGNVAELPAELEGFPVTELAPYAFSAHMDERKLEKGLEEGSIRMWGEGDDPVLKGMELKVLYLPETMRKIGAYAFYNCNALEELHFSDALRDLGAGLFTGCHHVRKLQVTMRESEATCLQDILQELPEKMQVVFHGKKEAQVLFPEFFEEGTENTPARNLSSTMHGSGMNFRYCFYQKRFEFRAYDSKFYWATVKEDVETILDVAQQRLRFPVDLSEEAKTTYENWLRVHLTEAGTCLVRRKDMEGLRWMTGNYEMSKELLQLMAEEAAREGFTEGTGFLLDLTHKLYKPKVRKFEL